jgi:hypothetical protein
LRITLQAKSIREQDRPPYSGWGWPVRLSHLWVAVGLASGACLAQEICGVPKHGPSADALGTFEKIQGAVGIEPGTILLYASSDSLVKSRSGAVSIECPAGGGVERWIVYDPDLLKGDALYFALAHETAHHLNSDPISGETPGKQQELRADYFAALYLTKPPLNWSSQRLVQALSALPLPTDAKGGYPSIEERRAQVNEGYAKEYALLHPNPTPATVSEQEPMISNSSSPQPKTAPIPPDRLLQAAPFRARMDDCPERSCDIEFVLRGYDSKGRLRYDNSARFKNWITGQFRDTVFNSIDKMYFEHQERISFQIFCRLNNEPFLVGDQRELDWTPWNEGNEVKNYAVWLNCGGDNFKASAGIGVNVATSRISEPPVRKDPGQPK